MVIANPIFDVVFKRLMEDKRAARFFIETMLDETIEDIQIRPQEFTYSDKLIGIAVFRLDFIATVKTSGNGHKKILIEIQKAKHPLDLIRFRNYLGEQYKTEDEIDTGSGIKKSALPIVTIYLLGFNLPEIETSVVKVNRHYTDLLTHQVINKKSDFIEKLTHDCYVVQLQRIKGKMQTRLEKLLGIFEQNYFIDERGIVKEYNNDENDEQIKSIIDLLHYVGTNPKEKKEIEDEQEGQRVINLWLQEGKDKLYALDKALEEKDKAIDEKDKAIDEKDKAIDEKDKAIDEKDKAINEKDRAINEINKELSQKDKLIEELMRKLDRQ